MKNILSMAIIAVLAMSCGQSKEHANKAKNPATYNTPLSDDEQQKTEDKVSADSTHVNIRQNEPLRNKQPLIDWDKKIIKTANITLELKDYATYNANIHKNVKSFGAYIAGEEQSQTDGGIENNITIKVPVEQFENVMASCNYPALKLII